MSLGRLTAEPLSRTTVRYRGSGSYADFIGLLASLKSGDSQELTEVVRDSAFQSLRVELPPLDADSLATAAEFVLIDSPELIRPSDSTAFHAYFRRDAAAVAFDNLAGDARLIAPVPDDRVDAAHLAAYVRTADDAAVTEFWSLLADEVLRLVGSGRRWVSTAGAGVPWLHGRIDVRPKYFRHTPYRDGKR